MIATVSRDAAPCAISELRPTVFVVDDDPDVRRTVALLARSVDLVVNQFASAQEFLECFTLVGPACLVLDMRMPGMSGLELQKELAKRDIRLPIIFITAHGEIANATAAMRAGAIDFLRKPYNPQILLERIHEAIEINQQQIKLELQRIEVQSCVAKLTERELQVMKLLAQGDSTKTIASKLGICIKTVDNHRSKILDKMGVDNVAQLACAVSCLAEESPTRT